MRVTVARLKRFFEGLRKRRHWHHCQKCDSRLSEWFVKSNNSIHGNITMYCYRCGWMSPWVEHPKETP